VVPAGPRTLTTFLIHRNSRESRDSDDQMQKVLNRTKKRPESLEEAGQSASKAGSPVRTQAMELCRSDPDRAGPPC
jgi:hypothetical protein